MTDVVPEPRPLDAAGVRALIGEPAELTQRKVLTALDEHLRAFIARSPFVALGTVSASGRADVSPRGDPPGFVRVLDDRTLALPERPGNRLIDSLTNILETGSVGLLFLVPGVDETVRVNGRATITDHPELLERMAVRGRPPKLAVLVHVEEAYVHCAKAFKRSELWDPASRIERSELPSIGRMIVDQVGAAELTVEGLDAFNEEELRTNLY